MEKRKNSFDRVKRLLRSRELNGPKLASILQCSEQTARNRISNPGTLSLAEIHTIVRATDITADEMREAIVFSQWGT